MFSKNEVIAVKHILYSGMMDGLIIDRSTRDGVYNMVKHWHPEYEIQYFFGGRRHFFIEDHSYTVKPGSLVLVNSKVVHNTYSDKFIYHDRVLLLIEKEKFEDKLACFGIDLPSFFKKNCGVIQIPKADRPYVEGLFDKMADETARKGYLFKGAASLEFCELILYLARLKNSGSMEEISPQNQQEANEMVNRVTRYIRENSTTVGSLEELSHHFFVDKSYLSRIFKKDTGHTVTEFINIQKIQHAQRLLEDTDDTIQEISVQVGYDSMTYFNRVFKKYIETSPLQYRKKQVAYKKALREKNNF